MTPAPPHAPPDFTQAESRQARRLGTVLVLTAVFVVLEFAGAIAARSQVLLADAVHLLLDVFALGLSIVAMRIAIKAPTERFTFGFRRVEPLTAVLNGVLVLLASTVIVAEAWADLRSTVAPRPTVMLVVAAAALGIHGWSAWLIHDAIEHRGAPAESPVHEHGHPHRHHGHTLNLRGVWLHLVGDALGAIAALVAAIVIRAGGPTVVDPLGGILVALLLAGGALKLLHDAALVLLDAAPAHLPTHAVRELVRSEPGVAAIAHLRVWTLGAGHDAVAVKVKMAGEEEARGLAARLGERLRHELGVELVTVEVTQD